MNKVAEILGASNEKTRIALMKENLLASDEWALRGLLAIANRQTADEYNSEATSEDNGVGFTAFDAEILTSFAKQVERFNNTPIENRRYNTPLSDKQMLLLRKRIGKYAGQLVRIAKAKQQVVQTC